MKKHFLAVLTALALFVPSVVSAQTYALNATLDHSFYTCSPNGSFTVHATAVASGTGVTPQHRVKWNVSGPLPDSDGAIVNVNAAPAQLGNDLQDTFTYSVHCDEWGFYQVTAYLVPPSTQTVLAQDSEVYEATWKSSILIKSVDSYVQNGCSSITMGVTMKDSLTPTFQLVKGFPITYFLTTQNGGGGRADGTTGTTTQTAGKLVMTIPVGGVGLKNGGGIIEVCHGPAGGDCTDLFDPFTFNEVFINIAGCP